MSLQEILEKHSNTPLKQTHRKAAISSALFVVFLVMVVTGGEYLARTYVGSFPGFLQYILVAVAIFDVIFIFINRSRILSQDLPGPDESDDSREREYCRRLFSAYLVTYGQSVLIGVMGVILHIITGERTFFIVMVAAAFFLMVIFYPRLEDWNSRLKEFLGKEEDLATVMKRLSVGGRR